MLVALTFGSFPHTPTEFNGSSRGSYSELCTVRISDVIQWNMQFSGKALCVNTWELLVYHLLCFTKHSISVLPNYSEAQLMNHNWLLSKRR